MNQNKTPRQVFNKSMYGVITIIALSSFLLTRGKKEKNEFQSLTGQITSIERTYQELPIRNPGKFRYLIIDNYQKAFEIFVGKDPGDFKPELEKIDELKVGDKISVYFEENLRETDLRINRLLQFIDKDSTPYFIRGNQDKVLGFGLLAFGIIMGILLLILKNKGTIT
jgi:hypothetical protein